MTITLGPGTLYGQDPVTCEWHKIGVTTEPMEVHHVAPPEQLAVVRPRALKGRTVVSWTLSRRQTRQAMDVLFPGERWRLWDGPRARREYDRRRRSRRRSRRSRCQRIVDIPARCAYDGDMATAASPDFERYEDQKPPGRAPKRCMKDDRKNEPDEYRKMIGRMIRSLGRKIAEGDAADLPELFKLREALDEAILDAVAGLIGEQTAFSWGELAESSTAAGFPMTRQGMQQRYGKPLAERGITPARKPGPHPRFK